MKWFRFYHSILDSVKVRTLPDSAQVDYTLLLCCASEYREKTGQNTGATGLTVLEAAWRMRRATLAESITPLVDRQLIGFDDAGGIVVLDWDRYQRSSDDTAPRQKKRYDKTRNQPLGAGGSENG